MKVEIRNYVDENWDELKVLIDEHWEKNHPLTNKELFDWQYNGFGEYSNKKFFKLLFVDGKIEGFRGVIPGKYQYYDGGKRIVKPGVAFAVWLVTKQYRGQGLGYQLLKAIEKDSDICLAIGSNPKTSVPIYRKNEYAYTDAFYRYVLPLDAVGYQLLQSKRTSLQEIICWTNSILLNKEIKEYPIEPDASVLAKLWDETTKNINIFSTYRDTEFWTWRYIENVGFKYLFFGNEQVGYVIARVENVLSDEQEKNILKVLRIIEIFPTNEQTWKGNEDIAMTKLMLGVLQWAKEEKCVAADFQCSSKIFEKYFEQIGFRIQTMDYEPEICSLAGMFSPLVYEPAVNNAHWKIRNEDGTYVNILPENTYFVKSDNDRDRPNRIDW